MMLKPRWDGWLIALTVFLVLGESLLCLLIIRYVPYTEIDWQAYMEQVQTFLGGERDYLQIRGGTGPLVYPAGFLYIYSFLSEVTNKGNDIVTAQLIFAAIYVATQALLFATLGYAALRSGHAPGRIAFLFVIMCLSRRLHSLYVLRLFNDGIAMLLLHISMFLLIVLKSWPSACFFFSLAASVKMNILLFAPGLLLLLLHRFPGVRTIPYLLICAVTQVIAGMPFLIEHPISYLRKSFELDRQFFHIWSVNWQFIPEFVFTSKYFAVLLLGFHILGLVFFTRRYFLNRPATLSGLCTLKSPVELDDSHSIDILIISNFVGIVFSRTIHYQFYTWYGHHLPWLLFRTQWPVKLQLAVWLATELVYNIYPPRAWASLLLQASHLSIFMALYLIPARTSQFNRIATTEADKSKPI